ncbi:hypothetical protein BaRGS_00006096, partial [Batillaria attramentaria]
RGIYSVCFHQHRRCCLLQQKYLTRGRTCGFPLWGIFSRLEPRDRNDVTIVTAFLDLGSFRKGGDFNSNHYLVYTPKNYLDWAEAYKYLANPLVVYTDSSHFQQWFLKARTGMEKRTSIVRIDRADIPAYQRIDKVARVFSDPNYPRFYPNTVLPEYACSQHAKVDFVAKSIRENPFGTKYFAWLDIGYFRDALSRKRKFWIVVPPEMDDSKIAVNQVASPNFALQPEEIFKTNKYWVGGGMAVASGDTYLRYADDYHRALDYFLEAGLFNTDQQLIYSMFSDFGQKTLNVTSELQIYAWSTGPNTPECWFYLGFLCYKEE